MPKESSPELRFGAMEERWRTLWREQEVFEVDREADRSKYFVTFPFPYMDGPLHLGAAFTGARLDVMARYERAKGKSVMFPWAWHWTGEAVMGTSDRIKRGDENLRKVLREVDHVPDDVIDTFIDPENLVRYYTEQNREAVKSLGFSIDWRREFHTSNLHPAFGKFVEWQIRRLADEGYIVQGSHPVVWCPSCESPTGDHDRLEGEGVRPEEYVLIKFRLNGRFLVAGSLRPETIFGATNIWVKPEVEYVEVRVDGENWIVAREAVEKLEYQFEQVEEVGNIDAVDLIGRRAVVPIINREVPVLPASFVDPSVATGVVYSVPSHAPIDWLALRDIKEDPSIPREFGLDESLIESVNPISIIDLEGYGDHPGIEVCENIGCENQEDPKVEEATEIVYTREFHMGVMKANCLEFSGLSVKEAKAQVRERLITSGLAGSLHDLPDEVICRSGDTCVVKVIRDQWFLKYSDEDWKAKTKEAIRAMNFYPPELKALFLHYVDWYRDWACTRRTGLGTPFPFDEEWIVETLTDSTVYMIFYIVARYYNSGEISADDLNDEFFDYMTLGLGDPKQISENTTISPDLLRRIREDFLYWYPVDLRGSGKDLVGNHLTFYVFHHTALFPREFWPRSMTVNGYVQLEGHKMSKSRGWYIPLRDAVEEFGADATRLTLLLGGEGLDDPDWRRRNAVATSRKVKALHRLVHHAVEESESRPKGVFERILLSKLQRNVTSVTDNLEQMKTASAARTTFYDLYNDLRDYLNLSDRGEKSTVSRYVETWSKLLQPFAPFIAEELWHSVCGEDSPISTERWPDVDPDLISPKDEVIENYLNQALDDVKDIIKALPEQPTTVTFFVAAPWKWEITKLALSEISDGSEMGSVISRAVRIAEDARPKDVSELVQSLYNTPEPELEKLRSRLRFVEDVDKERRLLEDVGRPLVEAKTGLSLRVSVEDSSSKEQTEKAHRSMPLRPGIYLE